MKSINIMMENNDLESSLTGEEVDKELNSVVGIID
jgi:hypothetical protein